MIKILVSDIILSKLTVSVPSGTGNSSDFNTTDEECCVAGVSTVVSHIYASRFATVTLVESVGGGAYLRDLKFYLANTPPLPVPTPRC